MAIMVALSAYDATAATYYVSRSGSDSNNGSQSNSWASISKAASSASSGDIVLISAGSYPGTVTAARNSVFFFGSGGVTNVGNVNLNGSNIVWSGIVCSPTSAGGYAAITVNGSYCLLTNSTVANYGAVASDQATMINLNGNFDTVENATFANMNDIDVFHIWGHDHLIQGILVTNVNEVNYSQNHTDFVQTWGGSTYNVTIRACEVINSTLQLGNTEMDVTGGTWGWTFENCIFKHIANTYFSGIPNTKFYNCVFDDVGTNQATPIYWYASTVSGNQRDSTGGEVMNTVFSHCSPMAGNGFNVSLIKQACNYSGSNPGFVNQSQGDYRLSTNSVLIGAGTNRSDVFVTDITGAIRSAKWDIGAYAATTANYTNLPPQTNVLETNYIYDHYFVVQGTTRLAYGWTNTGYNFVVRDGSGVVGSTNPPFVRSVLLSNKLVATIVVTNPVSDTNLSSQLITPPILK